MGAKNEFATHIGKDSDPNQGVTNSVDSNYAKFVLIVMLFVFMFNYLDRTIFAILAEPIKKDFGLSDGDLGFLNGAAFAIFFAIFGIPFARLADCWKRTRLISLGLATWSLMTFLSGTSKNFISLALFRFGVGVGEASATPAAHSLLYDYFSPKYRTTVLAIYACGASVGAGLGLFLGGFILDGWNDRYPDLSIAPFGLSGWQAAFMIVGFPGLLLAVLVACLKEPVRGEAEGDSRFKMGDEQASEVSPIRVLVSELSPMVPVLNLWILRSSGAGQNLLLINILMLIITISIATAMIYLTNSFIHWVALGFGIYAAFSWVQSLYCREPLSFELIFKCKTVLYIYLSSGLSIFVSASAGFWMIQYFQRSYQVSATETGAAFGLITVLAGVSGGLSGGVLADKFRARFRHGKLAVGLASNVFWLLGMVTMLVTNDIDIAYAAVFFYIFFFSMSQNPLSATINDLALPKTRALAQAIYIMILTFIGGALGPYFIGLLSDLIGSSGHLESSQSIRQAMLISMVFQVLAIILLVFAFKHLKRDEEQRLSIAQNSVEVESQ